MIKLAIIIPVWNNWRYTKNAIEQLSKLPDDHKIIIVDNGSTDETKNLKSAKKVDVVRHQDNLGFARGCNAGYVRALELESDNVLFLNNDIKVFGNPDSWTRPLIASAEKGHIAGPTVGCLDDNLNFICEAPKWPSRGHGYLSGWCICASTETWQNLTLRDTSEGPFSTSYGLAYWEDTDLGFRAKELGIQCDVIPVPVKHLGKATSKKINLSELYLHAKGVFLKKWGKNAV